MEKRCIDALTLAPQTPLRQAVKAFSEAYIQATEDETVVVTLFGWKENDASKDAEDDDADAHDGDRQHGREHESQNRR